MTGPGSDRDLIRRLGRREERAFVEVFERHKDRVYGFSLRLSGRRDAAEELFQHAFVRLAECARSLDEETSLAGWLLTVVRNHHTTELRKRGTHARNQAAIELETSAAETPLERTERRAALERLERLLQQLPEQHREVLLLMAEGEDLPQAELAKALGTSPEVFRKRLSRARRALAEAWTEGERDRGETT